MRVFLCGQRYFGQETYELLKALGCEVVGVSAPARHPDGSEDRLFRRASLDGVRVIPGGLRADDLPDGLDLIVAAHSWDFISRKARNRAALGAIGYHPSLLPLHRGRDAVRWAVKMGDRITGGTVYWLTDNVDAGPIAAQDWCFIHPGDDAQSLWRRSLQPMGLRLFHQVLTDIAGGLLVKIPQDETLATWEPSWERQPIPRPDLLMLGGAIPGYQVILERKDGETR